jgi:hypothetical protein
MPYYVQRDFSGKVVTLYSHPAVQDDGFCLTEPDPLADDHPEILAFLAAQPVLPAIKMPTEAEMAVSNRQWEQSQEEARTLQKLMLAHFTSMSHLELALGALLQQLLNVQSPALHVARAIYFSIPGFDQRCVTVGKAVQQFVEDHMRADRAKYSELEHLAQSWSKVRDRLAEVRGVRNVVAHGSISMIQHGGRYQARLMAPVFDPIRVGNPLAKGSNPGLGVADLQAAMALMQHVARCVDRLNDSFTEFHKFGVAAVVKQRPRLEANLTALEKVGRGS